METKANYVLIGAFTVAVMAAAFGFILWLAKTGMDQNVAHYDILFEGSVTGLNIAGDVRFQGVRVGQVTDIRIYEKDPKKVRVRIEIDGNTPVNSASLASLEFFGITGVLFVQISSGAADAAPLKKSSDSRYAIIPSKKSGLEAVFASAPRVLENAALLMERLRELVNDDNRQSIENILNNAEMVSTRIAGKSDEIEELIDNANTATRQVADLTGRLDRLAGQAETTLNTDVRKLLAETTELADGLNSLVSDNREAINRFSERGLGEFASFVVEARALVITLDRVAQRMESDPARFFLGTPASEYKPE